LPSAGAAPAVTDAVPAIVATDKGNEDYTINW